MPRPTLTLTDDEARQLVVGIAGIEQLHPLDSRNHKPFLRAFLRLVHGITGRTYSPSVYRRLLGAFAPDRTPSTTTIAAEKDRLVEELDRQREPIVAGAERPALIPAAELESLHAAMAQLLRQGVGGQDNYFQKQCAFLQQRLNTTERELVDTKVLASRVGAEQAAARDQAERALQEVEAMRAAAAALTQEIARLTTAVEDAHRFALLAIDDARSETRAWKDRCHHAEAQIKAQTAATEVFRRLAYRQGADIPAIFSKPGST